MPSVTMIRDEAVQRWPVPIECAVDGARDRALEIGVVEHHERVLAAHLELHARLALGRAFGDARADRLRAGEGNAVDALMVDDRAADVAFADHQVEHARRRAGLEQDLRQRMRDRRRRSRGLQHHGIAEGERGRGLPRGNRDREIPRRDQAEHADRLAIGLDVDPGPRGFERLAVPPKRLASEIFEDARGAHDFARAFGERLAFLARQQRAELLGAAHDQRAGLVEHVGADLRRRFGPGRECGARGLYRVIRLRPRRPWDSARRPRRGSTG